MTPNNQIQCCGMLILPVVIPSFLVVRGFSVVVVIFFFLIVVVVCTVRSESGDVVVVTSFISKVEVEIKFLFELLSTSVVHAISKTNKKVSINVFFNQITSNREFMKVSLKI